MLSRSWRTFFAKQGLPRVQYWSSRVQYQGSRVSSIMEECEPPPAKKICPDGSNSALNSGSPEEKSLDAAQQVEGKEGVRFGKRRKFAVFMSYNGQGYMGMQKNPDVRTIEEDLLVAMRKALAFPAIMENDLKKLKFQRTARTDKGVSASRQLVSIKHMVDLKDPVALINAHLPPQIRVMAVKRVTKSFDSRHMCNARMYEYLLPTYTFAPYHLTKPEFRIPDDTVSLVDKLLSQFVGTHNYHNFTSGKKYSDMSSRRFMMSFKSGKKFVAGIDTHKTSKEMEFLPLRVKGQSFVLHQIRKMVGFVIAIVRGRIEEAEFGRVFEEEKVDIPKAPSLGLLLENVYFDGYNARFCNSGERERLEWEGLEPQVEDFKKKHIYHTIIETEIKEMPMMQWLHTLQLHNFHETAERLHLAKKNSAADETGNSTNTGTETPHDATDTAEHQDPLIDLTKFTDPSVDTADTTDAASDSTHSKPFTTEFVS